MRQKLIIIGLSIFCVGILTFSCNDKVENTVESKALKDSLEAIKVLDIVSHMPEVIDRKKIIEDNSNGGRKLSVWIVEKPGRSPYYSIAVGEDAGNTESGQHFNFHVYPDSMRVLFYDMLNEREILPEVWRAQNK